MIGFLSHWKRQRLGLTKCIKLLDFSNYFCGLKVRYFACTDGQGEGDQNYFSNSNFQLQRVAFIIRGRLELKIPNLNLKINREVN